MASTDLRETDLLTLIAAYRIGADAYGVTIQREIGRLQEREVSMAAVYAALERLVAAGFVRLVLSEPRPERGGRARRQFEVTASGRGAIRRSRADALRLWRSVLLPRAGRRQ